MSKNQNQGMDFLTSLPRRWVTVYIPLILMLIILLFPFYWMGMTAFKPNEELLSKSGNPFWLISPTIAHFKKLLFHTSYPAWLLNTVIVSVCATFISLFTSVLAAYAIERLRFKGSKVVGMLIFFAYLVPPSIIFIPLASIVYQYGLFDTRLALILTYPTFLVPFCTWLLMGYFRSIPYELEECALIDGANRWQMFWKITIPLIRPILVYVMITSMIGGLQMFDVPQILTNGKGATVQTVEHLMAALAGLGVHNALVEIDGPVPADVLAKVQALPQVKQAKALVF